MTQTQIILAAVIVVAIVALALLARRSGPRVTTIERSSEKKDR